MAIDLDTFRASGYTVTVTFDPEEAWNAAFPDIHARLSSLETWEEDLASVITEVSETAADLIQNSVGPQLDAANAAIAAAQEAVEDIIVSGTALDSARLGNQLPAHYLDLANATGTLARNKFAITFNDWVVTNFVGVSSQVAARAAIGAISAGEVTSGFASASHTHTQADISGLIDALNAKAPSANAVFTGTFKYGTSDVWHAGNLLAHDQATWTTGTSVTVGAISPAILKAVVEALAPQPVQAIPASVAAGDNVALTLSRQVFETTSDSHVDIAHGLVPVVFVAVAPGVIRVKAEHRKVGATDSSVLRFFKNGVQINEWSTSSASFQTRSADITVQSNDRITFTHRMTSSSRTSEVRNITINTAVAGDATRFIGYSS